MFRLCQRTVPNREPKQPPHAAEDGKQSRRQLSSDEKDNVQSDLLQDTSSTSTATSKDDLEIADDLPIPRPISVQRDRRSSSHHGSGRVAIASRPHNEITDLELQITEHGCIDW